MGSGVLNASGVLPAFYFSDGMPVITGSIFNAKKTEEYIPLDERKGTLYQRRKGEIDA